MAAAGENMGHTLIAGTRLARDLAHEQGPSLGGPVPLPPHHVMQRSAGLGAPGASSAMAVVRSLCPTRIAKAHRQLVGQRHVHSRHGRRDYIPAGQRNPSAWRDQRWSSRTMVTLSTSVGLTVRALYSCQMYLLGLSQGFSRAQAQHTQDETHYVK